MAFAYPQLNASTSMAKQALRSALISMKARKRGGYHGVRSAIVETTDRSLVVKMRERWRNSETTHGFNHKRKFPAILSYIEGDRIIIIPERKKNTYVMC